MRHLNELWLQARERTGRRPTSPYKAHRYHRQMLSALRRRQPAAARRALRNHLQDMRADILAEMPGTRKRGSAEARKPQKRRSGG
jgi:DNA-binding GntR family transcriptional regulator